MQELWNGELPTVRYARICVIGDTGSGKSTLGATMPGPRYIIAADENATLPLPQTFEALPRTYLPPGEANRLPAGVVSPESWDDVEKAVTMAEQAVESRGIRSVIVDHLSTISKLCVRQVLRERNLSLSKGKGSVLERLDQQGFGLLASRMDALAYRLHRIPAHILWLCGRRPPSYEGPEGKSQILNKGGLDVDSKEFRRQFPQLVHATLHLEKLVDGSTVFCRLHTQEFDSTYAKSNVGGLEAVEPPDMYVILAKLGFLDSEEAQKAIAAVPKDFVAQQRTVDCGI